MRLNPTGPGVEPFLIALQASTDAAKSSGAADSGAWPIIEDRPPEPPF
jgi:hypothetical protein